MATAVGPEEPPSAAVQRQRCCRSLEKSNLDSVSRGTTLTRGAMAGATVLRNWCFVREVRLYTGTSVAKTNSHIKRTIRRHLDEQLAHVAPGEHALHRQRKAAEALLDVLVHDDLLAPSTVATNPYATSTTSAAGHAGAARYSLIDMLYEPPYS